VVGSEERAHQSSVAIQRIAELLEGDSDLANRLLRLRQFARTVRTAEYHITNACNIRCKGCWFFEYDFDHKVRERTSLADWRAFAEEQRRLGVTAALIIGGEPSLFLDRIALFVDCMPYVSVSSNGLRQFPLAGFEKVTIAISVFGGGTLDDSIRGVRPNGSRFDGLFTEALKNYRNDERAIFIFALAADGMRFIEETVERIADNGNRVTFNYYSSYGTPTPLCSSTQESRLLDEALRVREKHPDAVVCHPYYIRTLISGKTDWGQFGYEVCPSISVSNPVHRDRIANGNPVLPGFNSYAADAEGLNFCCTSGHCDGCRDSQAVYSWLLVSLSKFLGSKESLRTWVEIAESYWRQFVWSPYHVPLQPASGHGSSLGVSSVRSFPLG
jgi:MoaA/NifB/PqqE/SkfB family radical SAM enzyme